MTWAAKAMTLCWDVNSNRGASRRKAMMPDHGISAANCGSTRKPQRGWATKSYETGHYGSFLASASIGPGGVDLENNLLSSLIGRQLGHWEL